MIALPTDLTHETLAVHSRQLVKTYGAARALDGLDLQVPEHSVYLLVGKNGAGKTTALRILLDLIRASAGQISVLGLDPVLAGDRVRANIGYVPEQLDWGYGWMTAERLLAHHACYYPGWDSDYARQLCEGLDVRTGVISGQLSKGQRRALYLVLALAHRPAILLLDEPTDGFDPVARDTLLALLTAHLAETSTTVLLSTHHVNEFAHFATHLGLMHAGQLRVQIAVDELQRSLHRYRADVPEGWRGCPPLHQSAVQRVMSRRQADWIVWGEPSDIAARLEATGARVRDTCPLTLEAATIALLAPSDGIR